MRALLISPESPLSFWTFRETCRIAGCKTVVPPLGLLTVAALLPAEWELRLVDLNAEQLKEKDWDWAEIVMLSGMVVQREGLLALTRDAKCRGKIVVAGGPYPTLMSDEVLNAGCDFLVKGEAENTIDALVSAIEQRERRGLFENLERPDLSRSPVPRFDLAHLEHYVSIPIQISRGCPYDCEFCDIATLYGRKPRYKTPDQVIQELELVYHLGWRRDVFVSDDNFIGDTGRARAILKELAPWMERHGKPFDLLAQTSITLGRDPEMIDLMTRANFGAVFIGIESPDEDVLALTSKHQNIRDPLLESVDHIKRGGLTVIGSFIIGLDGEKPGAGERICAFIEEADIPIAMINSLQAVPNTRFWNRLKSEGRLLESRTKCGTILDRPNFIPTRPEAEVLTEYRDVWDYLYEPSRFLSRLYRYYRAMGSETQPTTVNKTGSSSDPVSRSDASIRFRLSDLPYLLRLCWALGVRSRVRGQFWQQVTWMLRENPGRLYDYLKSCAIGGSMFEVREVIVREFGSCEAPEQAQLPETGLTATSTNPLSDG